MKKLLLTFSLAVAIAANAQKVIITGAMFDPQGADAPATTDADNGNHANLGGYEYIQLMATDDINFAITPYCVVRCVNTGSTTGAPDNGWAETNSTRTFKFNIISGTVNKGEFFYVGGPDKTAGGFLVDGGIWYPVLDMSSSKWLRTIAYSNGTTTAVGDDGIGIGNTGLFPNSVAGTAANPIGIAVFSGTSIDKNSTPIDVIFTGYINPITSTGSVYKSGSLPSNGYKIPTTDRYTAGYYADGGGDGNKYAFLFQPATNVAYFLKLSGEFNTTTNTWKTSRTANYVQLCPPSGTAVDRTSFATLAMLEGSDAGYNGTSVAATSLVTTTPVTMTSFTAKANKQGTVNLNWATASEQNNSHFEVNRSADGSSFGKIGEVVGNGTSNAVNNYNYTDNSPVAGVNYYQLKQVDNNGNSALSNVVSAKVGLSQSNLSATFNKGTVSVNYKALATGKATFTVYSVSGAKLASVTQNVAVGANQLSLPVTLDGSLHLLQVQQGSESVSVKF